MLRSVMFDLDETLVDQATAARAAVLAWSTELGIRDPDVQRRWSELSRRHYPRYQRRELTFAQQRRARVRDFLGVPVDDREADQLFDRYLEHYEAGWTVYDDTLPALTRARAAGLLVVVLTNGDQAQQQRKLDRLSLAPAIDLLVASSALPAGKPDPRAFVTAAALAGADVSQLLMVGNSLVEDVLGARAVGIDAVLVDRDGHHRDAEVPRIASLDELSFTG